MPLPNEKAVIERALKLRDEDPAAYDALPAVVKDHAQIVSDLRESQARNQQRDIDNHIDIPGDEAA